MAREYFPNAILVQLSADLESCCRCTRRGEKETWAGGEGVSSTATLFTRAGSRLSGKKGREGQSNLDGEY